MPLNDLDQIIPEAPLSKTDAPTLNDVIPEYKDVQRQGIESSLFVAGQTTPDRAGEAIHLANQYQVDPGFAHENLDELKKNVPNNGVNIDKLVDQYPGVSNFFQKPENASVGHDDLDALGKIDQTTRYVSGSYLKDIKTAISSGFNDFQKSVITMAASHGLIDKEMAAFQLGSLDREAAQIQATTPDYVTEFQKILQGNKNDLSKSLNEFSSSYQDLKNGQILQSLKDFKNGTFGSIGSLLDLAGSIVTNPKAFGYTTAESLTPLAPTLALGGLSTISAPLGVTAGFLGGAPIFIGQYFDKIRQEKGLSVDQALSDPNILSDLRGQADRYGITMGALNSLLPLLGGRFASASRVIEPGLSGAANTAARVGADLGVQTAGLAGSQIAAESAANGKPDISGVIQNSILNLGQSVVHEAIGVTRRGLSPRETIEPSASDILPPDIVTPPGETITVEPEPKQLGKRNDYPSNPVEAVHSVAVDTKTAMDSLQNLQALDEMGQAVKESKVAKRVPDKIEELIQSSGGNGNIYFDPLSWDKYWTDKGLSPAKAAADVLGDEGHAYQVAKETGGQIEIPLSTYVSKVAPTEHYDPLLNYVKTSADGMTFQQADDHMKNLPETVNAISQEAETATSKPFSSSTEDPTLRAAEEIDKAKADFQPLFKDPITEGMTDKQAAKYVVLQKDLRDYSESRLRDQLQKNLESQQTAEYKAQRSNLRAQVETEINQQPTYQALSILKNGTLADGSPLPEGQFPIKLSKEAIKSDYGEDYLSGLPKGIYDKEFGVSADFAAEVLGFKSGEDLLHNLANAPEKKSLIDVVTDQRLRASHPDLFSEPQISDEVVKAIHNDKKAQMLRMELEHLANSRLADLKGIVRDIARKAPTDLELRSQADSIIASKPLNTIRPYEFELAERKAAKEAGEFLSKGDIEQAYQAKRKELLNHELYRSALEVQDQVQKGLQSFKKLKESDETLSKSRDMDLVNGARALLSQYGLGQRTKKLPSEYLKSALAYEPDKFQMLSDMLGPLSEFPSDYQSLSYGDFQNLKQAFDSLWTLAKAEKEISIEGKKLDVDLIGQEIKSKAETFKNKKPTKSYQSTLEESEKRKIDFSDFMARRRTAESIIDQWDRGDITGTFRKFLFTPVNEAIEGYRNAKVSPYQKIDQALKTVQLRTGKIDAPEIGYQFQDKSFLLGALLHRGNLSNLSKLLRGRGWGEFDENGALNRSRWDAFETRMRKEGKLTKADYDFVQAIWNVSESLKAEAQKSHKEMYGHYFNEVTAEPFENEFGKFEGGYYPAKVDPYENLDARTRAEKEIFDKIENSWQFPTTGRGFTKSRVEAYAAPLQLDLRFLKAGIDSVLRFSHIEPAVKDVAKLLIHPEIRSSITSIDPYAIRNILTPFLQRAASQIVTHAGENRFMDRFLRRMKSATQLQLLFLDVSNAFQQLGGLTTANVKVPAKHLRNAFFEFLQNPRKATRWVIEKSDFMKNHASDQLTNIEESINDLTVNPTFFDKVETYTKKSANFLSRLTQHLVDMTTWMGGYSDAIERGLSEKQAIRAGDSAVRLTQGSAFPEHLSAWASGSQGAAIFKIFTNYFLMENNLLSSEWAQASERGYSGWGRKAYVTAIGALAPTLFAVAIRLLMSGKVDKNDDHSYADDVLKQSIMGSIGTAASIAAPGGGSVAYSIMNAFTAKNPSTSNLSLSPVFSVAEKSVKGLAELSNSIKKHRPLKGSELNDIFTLLGFATNLPLAPATRPISYLRDIQQRNIKPPSGPADLVRGLVSGQGSPIKK